MEPQVSKTLGDVCVLGFGQTALSVCTYLMAQDSSPLHFLAVLKPTKARSAPSLKRLECMLLRVPMRCAVRIHFV